MDKFGNNINDHSGYTVSELFVIAKFKCFKEEVVNYKYFTIKEYEEAVTKIKLYQNTEIVRSTQCDTYNAPKHYEIAKGSGLKFGHLLSVILYTDYTKLSTDFSSTFRKNSPFEPLKKTKRRNSIYFWMSKHLREMIECFGACSFRDTLCGPFFCGLSKAMNIPSFSMRLCSPTSTSTKMAIALKFGGDDGIVLTLNNPQYTEQYQYLRGFNVSWLSRFKEEEERYHVLSVLNIKYIFFVFQHILWRILEDHN